MHPRTHLTIAAAALLAALAAVSGNVAASATSRQAALHPVSRTTSSNLFPSAAPKSMPATQSALRFQARVADELAYLDSLRNGASPASPARFRIQEQTDALNEQAVTVDQLVSALKVFDGATLGTPAQWRAWESATDLATQLRSLYPDSRLVGV